MKRELKFRAFGGSEEKYFVYFNLLNQNSDYVEDDEVQSDGGRLVLDKNEILDIQEFTGIIDCNGKDLYEGDIVKYGRDIRCVIYKDGAFQLKHNNKQCNNCEHPICNISNELLETIEIIGNIYENKEIELKKELSKIKLI